MTCRPASSICLLAAVALLLHEAAARGQEQEAGDPMTSAAIVSPVESLTDNPADPIIIRGDFEETLRAEPTNVHLIVSRAELQQGESTFAAARMAVFVTPVASGFDLAIYAEDLTRTSPSGRRHEAFRAFRLQSALTPQFEIRNSAPAASNDHPLLRAASARLFPTGGGQTSTVAVTVPQEFGPPLQIPAIPDSGRGSRRIQIRPRSNDPLRFESFTSSDTVPAERVNVITGGVNVLIEGLLLDISGQEVSPGIVDLSADRVVIWTQGDQDELEAGNLLVQSAESRLQIYLEGNIVIRQNMHTIRASHAFYDANTDRALLLNSELRAFIPATGGNFRLWAERIRQLGRDRYEAQNAWATTSPYGRPGYRFQATSIFLEPGPSVFNGIDPLTGQPVSGQTFWVTSLNNQFIVGDVPLFYLPRVSGPIEDPGIPIRRASVTTDRIFGVQLETTWDLTRLLGLPRRPGSQWDLLADYRSERGLGTGIRADARGLNGLGNWLTEGTIYYQYDDGKDNLGLDRRQLIPPDQHRGEVTWRLRQELPGQALLFGEVGFLADRNYLEQYNEQRFDSEKDVETVLGVRQDLRAFSGMIWGREDLSGFDATTDWLPRGDVYAFSQPLLNGLLYWNMHSSVGYADMQTMGTPTDPADPYTPLGLPYQTNASGLVAMTRHEIDAPFRLGAVNLEPFVAGEAAYWDEGMTGQSVDRYLLNAGMRARLTATRIMPFVQSDIFRLNGLAHKHDTFLEYSFTDSTAGLNELPQYNEIDENSQERFRTRYTTQVFPGVIPAEFNPRNYALRTGAGLWTSAPYHEIADDFTALRIGFRDRLQTRAGPPENLRFRDWMVWEYGATFFPDANRDNFGEDFGLLYSRYRWNLSDRTAVLTDATFDLFDRAQQVWSAGVLSQRSLRGSLYLGFREVTAEDYFRSQMLITSYSYQLSPKWISTGSYAFDVAASESRGSSLTISRVGLDWILHVGLGFDFSKDNVGVGVSLEPRFGPPSPTNLSYLLGLQN
jgi:hypothetical protein